MHKAVYRIFLFVLLFSPLAFGSVETWSLALMQCLTAAALLMLVGTGARRGEARLYEVPGFLPLLCLWVYMFFQVLPLPAAAVKLLSPATYGLYQGTAGILEPSGWMSLSLNKKATVLEGVRFTSYAMFYVLTVQLLSGAGRLRKTAALVSVFATALALSSILQHFAAPEKVLWFRELTRGGIPFGPYVNRDHYAGFMGMVLPVVVGLLLAYKPKVAYKSLRETVVGIFNQRRTNVYVLLVFSAVLIGASVFVSLSRGGIISLCFSMLLLGALLLGKDLKRGLVIMLVFVLLLFSVGWFGWEPVFERFGRLRGASGDISDLRVDLWKDSLGIIGRFPVFGTGFGSYVHVYKVFGSISNGRIVDHAHNDYLELLVEGGLVGSALAGWFLAAVFIRTARALAVRMEPYSIYLALGALAGMAYFLFHGFTDFNLHIGANGLYFFFLAGLAVSAAHTRIRRDGTYLKGMGRPFPAKHLALAALAALLVTGANAGVITAKSGFSSVEDMELDRHTPAEALKRMKERAYRASIFDPLEAKYPYAGADAALLLSEKDQALRHYGKAVGLDPLNGGYLQRAALAFSQREDYEMADKLLASGAACEPMNPAVHRRYALWLFWRGERERGLVEMGRAISIEPENTRGYIAAMLLRGLDLGEMERALPEKARPYLDYGDFLLETGRKGMAERAYLKAVEYAVGEKEPDPSYFLRVRRHFAKDGRLDEALGVMRKAASALPDNAGIRITLGSLYERTGIPYRAAEEYGKALLIDPGNKYARKRIESLKAGSGGAEKGSSY